MFELILILGAGFVCGGLNAVAGGGTFVTLPVLIWIGIPPVVANATATTMAVPGYCASAWAYRSDLRAEGALRLGTIAMLAAVGGVLGAMLLVVTSPDAFLSFVPWLLLLATLLFAGGPQLPNAAGGTGVSSPTASGCLILLVAIYGGYFNGGLGIVMLAALSLQGYSNLHGMNGLKNLLSTILSIFSVVTFVTADLIAWKIAAPMALSNVLGAYLTSRIVRQRAQTDILRMVITATGATMTALFFLF